MALDHRAANGITPRLVSPLESFNPPAAIKARSPGCSARGTVQCTPTSVVGVTLTVPLARCTVTRAEAGTPLCAQGRKLQVLQMRVPPSSLTKRNGETYVRG